MIEMNHDLRPSESSMGHRQRWRKRNGLIAILGAIVTLSSALPAAADSIAVAYTATKVSGSTWEYAYTLSGSVSAGDLLAIYFPLVTTSDITDLAATTSSFTTSALQPDASLPADGEYDIVTNVTTSTFSESFGVSFLYSGSGTPGSQSFTLYDSSFATAETGATTAAGSAVPEPGSLALLGGGLAVLMGCIRRMKK